MVFVAEDIKQEVRAGKVCDLECEVGVPSKVSSKNNISKAYNFSLSVSYYDTVPIYNGKTVYFLIICSIQSALVINLEY